MLRVVQKKNEFIKSATWDSHGFDMTSVVIYPHFGGVKEMEII